MEEFNWNKLDNRDFIAFVISVLRVKKNKLDRLLISCTQSILRITVGDTEMSVTATRILHGQTRIFLDDVARDGGS